MKKIKERRSNPRKKMQWRRGRGREGGEDIYRVALGGKPYEKKKKIKIFHCSALAPHLD
jgi:hypothetical protein